MFSENTDWRTAWMPRVVPKVIRLVEVVPSRTVFTRFIPPETSEGMPGSWQRYYRRWHNMTRAELDPALLELVPELDRFVPPARLFDKAVYSPWADGRLQQMLSSLHVDTLVISGAETEICVLATVLGAVDLGYRLIIATDAICSSADPTHDAMMEIYHSRYGMQVETAESAQLLEAMR
jgi:nicotinamidase-related amidase